MLFIPAGTGVYTYICTKQGGIFFFKRLMNVIIVLV